jgi:hypothetical protein
MCAGGTCSGSTPVSCDDHNACTTDSICTTTTGCTHTPVDCDDHDDSTRDWCDAVLGCQYRSPTPLTVANIVAILGELNDPCVQTDPIACIFNQYNCSALTAVSRHKLSVGKLLSPAGQQTLSMRGEATFATPVTIDPDSTGVNVVVADATQHARIVQATVPAGASDLTRRGWTSKTSSTFKQWTYADKSGAPIGGITKIKIKLAIPTGLVKIGITGRGHYQVLDLNNPLRAIVNLDPTAATGSCGELRFTSPSLCRPKSSGVTCK